MLKLKSRPLLFLAAVFLSLPINAQTANPLLTVDGGWRFSIGASAWSPASNSSSFAGNNAYVGSTQATVADNIQRTGGFAMINAEVHHENWGVMADFVYWQVNNGASNSTTYLNRRTSVYESQGLYTDQTILSGAATYTILNGRYLCADALLGVRYISSTSSADVTSVTISTKGRGAVKTIVTGYYSGTEASTSPIIGFKGRYRAGETEWFMPFYVDAGQGMTAQNLTWQAMAGVGYGFSWGDVALTYRALYFELGSSNGLTKYSNYGPQLGATVNF